jgi:hypothetical protein
MLQLGATGIEEEYFKLDHDRFLLNNFPLYYYYYYYYYDCTALFWALAAFSVSSSYT